MLGARQSPFPPLHFPHSVPFITNMCSFPGSNADTQAIHIKVMVKNYPSMTQHVMSKNT